MHHRNPRKNADQWAQIIADFDQSGLSAPEYCHKHQLVSTTFSKWKRRFSVNSATVVKTPKFVPIQLSEPDLSTQSAITLQIGSSITLSISLDGTGHE